MEQEELAEGQSDDGGAPEIGACHVGPEDREAGCCGVEMKKLKFEYAEIEGQAGE